jgi:hypothetical protein
MTLNLTLGRILWDIHSYKLNNEKDLMHVFKACKCKRSLPFSSNKHKITPILNKPLFSNKGMHKYEVPFKCT